MKSVNGKRVNTEGLESEDVKKTNHFLDDEETRGIYYNQIERNRMWGYNLKLIGSGWETLGAL
jgi:hypothetical protein